ncbi:helix-turn-helix domain-containing protein [Brevundimonas sp. P7753]|uniref:helix-turn-helix domain-containing protein n=1 Tax=Brevundimonas sp. P7753 TaxID=2726982 RepID=UPI001C4AF792|nr:helix-turn-helix transcriptional regulator [Brevundimonas sp. P7753]
MTHPSLYDRIAALPRPEPGELITPPAPLIGFFVIMGRKARALKQSALADLAGVSLSTLERIERGKTVSAEALEKVTAALGMPADYFTAPRLPRPQKEMAEWIDFLSYVLNKHKVFKDLKPSRDRRAVPSPASMSRIDLL